MQEEMLKGIEEKNSKAGLDVNLRIIVNADNAGNAQSYIEHLSSAFSQYNYYEYGNSFINKIRIGHQKKLINDFIYRRFRRGLCFLLNTEEMASLYHFPLKIAETPNILWLTAKRATAPTNVPNEGIVLGKNIYRGLEHQIKIKRSDSLFWGDIKVQKNTRYFISKEGFYLVKHSPPKGRIGTFKKANGISDFQYEKIMEETNWQWDGRVCTKNKSKYEKRETSIAAGHKVIVCNDIKAFDWSKVNYEWYIQEALKLII